jgi:hypothetical protein
MSESLERCVFAIKKLNPHPHCYAKARFDPEKNKHTFWIVKKHLDDNEIKEHILGNQIIGGVGADDQGLTNVVGIDLDAHTTNQKPAAAMKKLGVVADALEIPIAAHTSKSGKGAHVRTIFERPIPVFMARALYMSLIVAAGLLSDASLDKVWPPVSGLGVLAMPYNSKVAKTCGGTVSIDPITLKPLRKEDQLRSLLEYDGMKLDEVENVLLSLGVRTEGEAIALAGGLGKVNRDLKDQVDGGIQLMLHHCDAVKRLEQSARDIPYEFWFSMMTNFKPFIGGLELFTEYSSLDNERFNIKELLASWRAISGGPRRCVNLDFSWQCPQIGVCKAQSPAGLPFHLVKEEGNPYTIQEAVCNLRQQNA